MNRWLSLVLRRPAILVFLVMLVYTGLIGAINPAFFSLDTVFRIVFNGVVLALVTTGISVVIITRNIDVSVGSLLGLAATLGGAVLNATNSALQAIAVSLVVGVAGGVFNGVGVAYLGVSPIIMTLGAMAVYRGLLIMYTGGQWIQTVPEFYVNFSRAKFLGLNASIWLVIVFLAAVSVLLSRTRLGRYFYAVGNNAQGANLQGISVRPVTVAAYAMCGFLAGVASLVYVSQIGAVPNMAGDGLETQAIAAAVIGGVSLSGGKGDVVGAALGAILLQTISYSLVYLKVPGYWNNAISGTMLLSVIVFSSVMNHWARQRKEARGGSRVREAKRLGLRTL